MEQRLRFWAGTWFLARSRGVPYVPSVVGRQSELAATESAITAQIESVAGVEEILDVTVVYDAVARHLTYTARARGDDGTIQINGGI